MREAKYVVKMMESEAGWGQDYWDVEFDTLQAAEKFMNETNAQNTQSTAPSYYVQALEIVTVVIDEPWIECNGERPANLDNETVVKVKFSTGKTTISKAWWINWAHYPKGVLHTGNAIAYYELSSE